MDSGAGVKRVRVATLVRDGAAVMAYLALARRYRPRRFADVVGQAHVVRALSNALDQGRLHHAYLFAGTRGVGKTSIARIVTQCLNCERGVSSTPCGECGTCHAIEAGRFVDFIELDAASRTGVEDMRDLLESTAYTPAAGRYKVYLVDEVHMLSKNAFNALLKTLEEPPEHVKFIFATTEIRKVPVTVLSRCQRFDLRRVDAEGLTAHFASIAEKEGAKLTQGALQLIARAADGSVRDGLSLLDQAIAHTGGEADEDQVRRMLGLADRSVTFDLMEALMKGDAPGALELLAGQYEAGADPIAVLEDLLELSHWLTRVKVTPKAADDPMTPEAERVRGRDMAQRLSMAALARAWQMLLKGLGEVRAAPRPLQAAEMILVRLVYASGLPTPEEALKSLKKEDAPVSSPTSSAPEPPAPEPPAPEPPAPEPMAAVAGGAPEPAPQPLQAEPQALQIAPKALQTEPDPASFDEVVALTEKKGEMILHANLINNVHLVNFEPGRIEFRLAEDGGGNMPFQLREFLNNNTARKWMVTVNTNEPGDLSLRQKEDEATAETKAHAAESPLVKEILETFPGAVIEDVREIEPEEGS